MAFKLIFMITGMVSITFAKPIMVSFGTRQGPIIPPTPSTTTLNPLAPKNPAPVHEDVDDIPNPNQYRAPTPHQYRKEIFSYKPNPNLILGTPLDIKYTPSLEKHELYRKKAQLAQSEGLGYRGPQVFGVQQYELDRERNLQQKYNNHHKTATQNFVKQYDYKKRQTPESHQKQPINQQANSQQQNQKQHNNQQPTNQNYQVREQQTQSYQYNHNFNNPQAKQQGNNVNNKYVPEIGIIYSSGLRYYVPQFYYYENEGENSVYDQNEPKYVYHRRS